MNECDISVLLGKTLEKITVADSEIVFRVSGNNDEQYKLYHRQDCCESVYIEDIIGSLSNLIGSPILMAEEIGNYQNLDEYSNSKTWTFYKLATIKGYVTICWIGTSNGYYSESVDFCQI